ncbi:hypothetical protein [Natrinema pallidum]|nr:hypothetical protein [Natrinema pallidum]QCW02130.1 hypothetical protein FGF80_02270 [Natrinema pallidum]
MPTPETDRDPADDRDSDARYALVRAAYADAIFDAIGTVLLLGFALLFLALGTRGLLVDASTELAVGLILGAVVLAGVAFGLVPPVRK